MAKKLSLCGKTPQTGHRVSHSHRKTNHTWMPNIQNKKLFSTALGRYVRVNISTSGLRDVDHAGGLDDYLLRLSAEEISTPLRRLQDLIRSRV